MRYTLHPTSFRPGLKMPCRTASRSNRNALAPIALLLLGAQTASAQPTISHADEFEDVTAAEVSHLWADFDVFMQRWNRDQTLLGSSALIRESLEPKLEKLSADSRMLVDTLDSYVAERNTTCDDYEAFLSRHIASQIQSRVHQYDGHEFRVVPHENEVCMLAEPPYLDWAPNQCEYAAALSQKCLGLWTRIDTVSEQLAAISETSTVLRETLNHLPKEADDLVSEARALAASSYRLFVQSNSRKSRLSAGEWCQIAIVGGIAGSISEFEESTKLLDIAAAAYGGNCEIVINKYLQVPGIEARWASAERRAAASSAIRLFLQPEIEWELDGETVYSLIKSHVWIYPTKHRLAAMLSNGESLATLISLDSTSDWYAVVENGGIRLTRWPPPIVYSDPVWRLDDTFNASETTGTGRWNSLRLPVILVGSTLAVSGTTLLMAGLLTIRDSNEALDPASLERQRRSGVTLSAIGASIASAGGTVVVTWSFGRRSDR